MTVVWSQRAVGHLTHLHAFIAEDKPAAAARMASLILDAIDGLVERPNLGRPGRIENTRELVVAGTPFVIAYRIRGSRLEILGVFHGRRRWPAGL